SDTISAEGATLVQFRALDNAGNATVWAPVSATAASTAKIDRNPLTDPTSVSGGSTIWSTAANEVITASGSTDLFGSGIVSYPFRTSTANGVTWGTPPTAASATITNQGMTLVQFRAVDNSGLTSNWYPSSPTPGSTVELDRTLPTAPTVTGGSTS